MKLMRAMALLMVLVCSVGAGEIPNVTPAPPPPTANGEIPNVITAALSILESVLSLF